MRCELLIPGRDTSAPLEPADAALDHIAASVLPLVQSFAGLVRSCRDHSLDASSTQPAPDSRIAVRTVAGDGIGSSTPRDSDRVHQRFEGLRFVRLSGRDERTERNAATVRHKMKLRAKASARSPQGVVCGLIWPLSFEAPAADRCARTLDPSTSKTLQSMRPCSSSVACNRGRMRSERPSRAQCRYRPYTVSHLPSRSGMSRYCAPLLSTQNIPLSTTRCSHHRPPRACFGSKSRMRSQPSSVSSYLRPGSPSTPRPLRTDAVIVGHLADPQLYSSFTIAQPNRRRTNHLSNRT